MSSRKSSQQGKLSTALSSQVGKIVAYIAGIATVLGLVYVFYDKFVQPPDMRFVPSQVISTKYGFFRSVFIANRGRTSAANVDIIIDCKGEGLVDYNYDDKSFPNNVKVITNTNSLRVTFHVDRVTSDKSGFFYVITQKEPVTENCIEVEYDNGDGNGTEGITERQTGDTVLIVLAFVATLILLGQAGRWLWQK
jgi:hypothetical protein